jgi:hypothetical protein
LPASISAVVITSGFDLAFALEDPAGPPAEAHATTAAIIRQDDNIVGKRRMASLLKEWWRKSDPN